MVGRVEVDLALLRGREGHGREGLVLGLHVVLLLLFLLLALLQRLRRRQAQRGHQDGLGGRRRVLPAQERGPHGDLERDLLLHVRVQAVQADALAQVRRLAAAPTAAAAAAVPIRRLRTEQGLAWDSAVASWIHGAH